MRRPFLTTAVLMVTLALVAGCASSPQSSFYTLTPVPPAEQADTAAPKTITIGAVMVPEIVDRPQLVLRVNANEVNFDEFARWADSLKAQVRRVIAADLALQFPSALVSGYPGTVDPTSSYQVSIDVESFESAVGDTSAVSVLWSVRPPKGATVNGRTVVRVPTGGPGYDALIAAHSKALAAVSGDIATAIRSTLRS
jgi:uncharacterized lipoprotein YmbA